MESAPAT
jgi:hypothetical protein